MTKIKGIQRLDDTSIRAGGSGDNWHTTWARDDRQYTALCDGSGWPDVPGHTGQDYNSRVFILEGNPPDFKVRFLPTYPDCLSKWGTDECMRYYNFGIIALGDRIYQFLSTPNNGFDKPAPRFVGAKLIYSPDLGRTWLNQNGTPVVWEPWAQRSRENMVFFFEDGDAYSLLTCLQMGRNYEHNTDGFVYVYAPNGNVEGTMNQLVMFRVPKDRILDRKAYEYFAGLTADGGAKWAKDIRARGIVHTFPAGWVNTQVHPYAWHPSVAYNAPLGLYMMFNWGMGCSPQCMWFGKPSYLGFYTAPQPWGPWTQVHEETVWTPVNDPGARAYQPQIIPRWIAPDGKSFWMVWTDFQVINDKRPHYAFNTQRVEIIT